MKNSACHSIVLKLFNVYIYDNPPALLVYFLTFGIRKKEEKKKRKKRESCWYNYLVSIRVLFR